jgi:hypothetical protein
MCSTSDAGVEMPTDGVAGSCERFFTGAEVELEGGTAAGSHLDAWLLPVVLLHAIRSDLSDSVKWLTYLVRLPDRP